MIALSELLRQAALTIVMGVVRIQFPDVPVLSTQQLAQRLESDAASVVLIDTREQREYAVSHLPGARHLPSLEAIQRAAVPREASLVVYCTVGYRSALLARQLKQAGYGKVANLEGSIVRWHHEGRPLVRGGRAVHTVHPYDPFWGRLLDPTSVAYH